MVIFLDIYPTQMKTFFLKKFDTVVMASLFSIATLNLEIMKDPLMSK